MKKLFAIDCHISIIADLQDLCNEHITIDDRSLSSHAHLIGKKTWDSVLLGNEKWKKLDKHLVRRFQDSFRDSAKNYDGFVCAHPLAFCLLWEAFDKPIYAINSTRYEHPFSFDKEKREWLNERIQAMHKSGQLRIVANNRFDKRYLKHHAGIDVEVIPSVCKYTRKVRNRAPGPFWVKSKINAPWSQKVGQPFPRNYSWDDLSKAPAIVYVPYQVSIMSFFEWYTMALPIIVPSKNWLEKINPFHEQYFNPKLKVCSVTETIDLCDFNDRVNFPHILQIDRYEDIFHITRKQLNDTSDAILKGRASRIETLKNKWLAFLQS